MFTLFNLSSHITVFGKTYRTSCFYDFSTKNYDCFLTFKQTKIRFVKGPKDIVPITVVTSFIYSESKNLCNIMFKINQIIIIKLAM